MLFGSAPTVAAVIPFPVVTALLDADAPDGADGTSGTARAAFLFTLKITEGRAARGRTRGRGLARFGVIRLRVGTLRIGLGLRFAGFLFDLLHIEGLNLNNLDTALGAGFMTTGDAGLLADQASLAAGNAVQINQHDIRGLDRFTRVAGGIPRRADQHSDDTEVDRDGTDNAFAAFSHISESPSQGRPWSAL